MNCENTSSGVACGSDNDGEPLIRKKPSTRETIELWCERCAIWWPSDKPEVD